MSMVPYSYEAQEDDASELLFPKDLVDAEELLISEVNLLLNSQRSTNTDQAKMLMVYKSDENEKSEDEKRAPDVLQQTRLYSATFAKLKNNDAICNVRALLLGKKLHKFELVSLANLCPETVEEARELVPSLNNRFEDCELQQIIDEIQSNVTSQ